MYNVTLSKQFNKITHKLISSYASSYFSKYIYIYKKKYFCFENISLVCFSQFCNEAVCQLTLKITTKKKLNCRAITFNKIKAHNEIVSYTSQGFFFYLGTSSDTQLIDKILLKKSNFLNLFCFYRAHYSKAINMYNINISLVRIIYYYNYYEFY